MHHSHHHHHHYHHHYYYRHHHQDMLKKNKIKNTCGCCGCYCCEWNLSPLVQSCIFSVSTFILLWSYTLYLSHQVHATARSRGFISSWFQDLAGNKPLTVLVKKVSVTKWIITLHYITLKKLMYQLKKEKSENLKNSGKKLHVSAGPKARKNDHFCIICLLLLLFLFVYMYFLSKWTNKCETDYKSKCN